MQARAARCIVCPAAVHGSAGIWPRRERVPGHSSTGLLSTFGQFFSTFHCFLLPHLELGHRVALEGLRVEEAAFAIHGLP